MRAAESDKVLLCAEDGYVTARRPSPSCTPVMAVRTAHNPAEASVPESVGSCDKFPRVNRRQAWHGTERLRDKDPSWAASLFFSTYEVGERRLDVIESSMWARANRSSAAYCLVVAALRKTRKSELIDRSMLCVLRGRLSNLWWLVLTRVSALRFAQPPHCVAHALDTGSARASELYWNVLRRTFT